MARYSPVAVRVRGGTPFSLRMVAAMPSPRRSKLTAGSDSGPVARPLPVTVPRRPRLPATRSTSASGKLCRSMSRSSSPAPSGSEPRASAARPLPEPTLASSLSRPSAVWPVASSRTGGRPAPRVIAEATSAAARSKRTSGAVRGPVTRAVPLTVPARPRSGRMALAMPSGRSRMARSRSKASSIRPRAVRLPAPTSRPSGVSSIAPSRMVMVAGAVSVAATPCWRTWSDASVAAKPPSRRASSPERSTRVPIVRRASAAKCMWSWSTWLAVACSEPSSMPASARSPAVSSPSISGRPRASSIRALASSWPIRLLPIARPFAPTTRLMPWPIWAASSWMSASTAPVASTSASAASGAMSGACRVSRPVAGAAPSLATSPLSRFGPTMSSSPDSDRLVPATARSPASCNTSPSRAPSPLRLPLTSVPSTCPLKPTRALVRLRPISLPCGIAAETSTAIGRPSPVAWPLAVREPARRGSTRARSVRLALKPMSVCLLEIWPSEAKASCGLEMRRSWVRMPPSSRTARPEIVVSPATSRSRRGSPRARSVVPPSKVRSNPPLSGLTVPVARRSTAPDSGRLATPAKIARSATRMALRPV